MKNLNIYKTFLNPYSYIEYKKQKTHINTERKKTMNDKSSSLKEKYNSIGKHKRMNTIGEVMFIGGIILLLLDIYKKTGNFFMYIIDIAIIVGGAYLIYKYPRLGEVAPLAKKELIPSVLSNYFAITEYDAEVPSDMRSKYHFLIKGNYRGLPFQLYCETKADYQVNNTTYDRFGFEQDQYCICNIKMENGPLLIIDFEGFFKNKYGNNFDPSSVAKNENEFLRCVKECTMASRMGYQYIVGFGNHHNLFTRFNTDYDAEIFSIKTEAEFIVRSIEGTANYVMNMYR